MVYYCWIIYFRRSADLRLRTAGRSCSGRVVWKAERKQAPPRTAVSLLCYRRPDHLPQTHHAIPERNPCPPENCCPESHPTNSSHPSPERRRKRHHFLCVQREATGLRMNFLHLWINSFTFNESFTCLHEVTAQSFLFNWNKPEREDVIWAIRGLYTSNYNKWGQNSSYASSVFWLVSSSSAFAFVFFFTFFFAAWSEPWSIRHNRFAS